MKPLRIILFFVFATTAYAQYGWQKVDTLTTGEFDDYNPQIDHGGLGMWTMWAPFEWVVFERWSGGQSSICGIRVEPSMNGAGSLVQWNETPAVISSAQINTIQLKPDICTIVSQDTITLAAWQESDSSSVESGQSWSIYYSNTMGNESKWSVPQRLTNGNADEEDVKVRPLSDSSFILMWKTGSALMFTTFVNGIAAAPDTLVVTNIDSTEFDCEQVRVPQSLDFQLGIAWIGKDSTGKTVCFAAQVMSLSPVQLSKIDTLSSDGDISNPKFLNSYTEAMTFDVEHEGRLRPVLGSRSLGYQNYPWEQQNISDDSLSDNFNSGGVMPDYLTSLNKASRVARVISLSFGPWEWERISNSDTAIVFSFVYNDTILSTGYNRNPSMSTYLMWNSAVRTRLAVCVWESNRSGRSHAYGRAAEISLGAIQESPQRSRTFILQQNYPNPFNPATTIRYLLSAVTHVTLKVYDVLGREVATLVDVRQTPGEHSVTFDASRLSSGVYFYKLIAGNFSAVKKLVVIK